MHRVSGTVVHEDRSNTVDGYPPRHAEPERQLQIRHTSAGLGHDRRGHQLAGCRIHEIDDAAVRRKVFGEQPADFAQPS